MWRAALASMLLAVLAFALLGCRAKHEEIPRRATLEEVTDSSVRVRPTADQPPYCLMFTASEKGIIRQLTMTDTSVPCEADKPIGDNVYVIPPSEGIAIIYVLFSDQPLESTSMAQQIHDLAARDLNFSGMDLRARGRVFVERLAFLPEGS
jgi:hypothetical protein